MANKTDLNQTALIALTVLGVGYFMFRTGRDTASSGGGGQLVVNPGGSNSGSYEFAGDPFTKGGGTTNDPTGPGVSNPSAVAGRRVL